nr:hypothetical protein CFP56_60239 [Quercus suber]
MIVAWFSLHNVGVMRFVEREQRSSGREQDMHIRLAADIGDSRQSRQRLGRSSERLERGVCDEHCLDEGSHVVGVPCRRVKGSRGGEWPSCRVAVHFWWLAGRPKYSKVRCLDGKSCFVSCCVSRLRRWLLPDMPWGEDSRLASLRGSDDERQRR